MLTFEEYIGTHVGVEQQGAATAFLKVAMAEGQWGGLPSRVLSMMEGVKTLCNFSRAFPYVPGVTGGPATETIDNSGTIANAAGGLRLQNQASPSANDDVAITWLSQATCVAGAPGTGKGMGFLCRVQVSDLDDTGLVFGLVTQGTTVVRASAPADGIYGIKANNAGTPVVGRVIENSNAADDVNINQDADGTDLTMADATDVVIGFYAYPGASADLSFGAWYCNGFATPFDTNQKDALRKLAATTPAVLSANIAMSCAGTTQRNAIFDWAIAYMER